MVGSNNWYWLDSDLMEKVGIKVSPKVDIIQAQLNGDYRALRKLTVGTDEYKAARQAYYAKRERPSRTCNGELFYGGTAERIMPPFAMDAQVTSMGTGKERCPAGNYHNFVKVRDRELKKDDPSSEHIKEAWDRFSRKRLRSGAGQGFTRVAAWAYALSEAKHRRREMLNAYSDYYEGKGESSASKYGAARVDAMNKAVKRMRSSARVRQATRPVVRDRRQHRQSLLGLVHV